MRPWGPSHDPSQSALPASTGTRLSLYPKTLRSLDMSFHRVPIPWKFGYSLKTGLKTLPQAISFALKKNKERVLYTPSRTRLISGVTNHQSQDTMGKLKKWLKTIIFLNKIIIGHRPS